MTDFHHATYPRARKPHRCAECHATVDPPATYARHAGSFEGRMYCDSLCLVCDEVSKAARRLSRELGFDSDDGPLFGEVVPWLLEIARDTDDPAVEGCCYGLVFRCGEAGAK